MDALPAEILHEIMSYLIFFGPAVNSLRLVNRKLSAAATIFKFRSLKVRVTRRGLENLLNVSRQPELARCVREITYPHALLAPMQESRLDDEEWYREPSLFTDFKPFTTRYFECYNDHYKEQTELQNSGESIQTLETALSRMANIRAIIPGKFNYDAHHEIFGNWRRALSEREKTLISRGWYEITHITSYPSVFQYGDREAALKAFIDLIKLLHRLKFKLDKFGGHDTGVLRGFFSDCSGLWNCGSLFQNLTSVYFGFTIMNVSEDTKAFEEDAKEGRMFKFLSLAPHLRILSLEMEYNLLSDDDSELIDPDISILDILGRGYIWKYLHTVYLSFPRIQLEDLVEFLGRHSTNLKFLHFGLHRLGCSWMEVLDFLKERLHLTGLKIDSASEIRGDGEVKYYEFNSNRRMEDYVLRGVVPFSLSEMGKQNFNTVWPFRLRMPNLPKDFEISGFLV
ncbi:hypothetical protein RUND412_008632 [Rhizina undulata]